MDTSKIQDAYAEKGRMGALKEGVGQGAGLAAKEGARALTGGLTTAIPGADKLISKLGNATGKAAVTVVAAGGTVILLGILAILGVTTGVFTLFAGNVSASGGLPKPTQEQCEAMPEGWCEVVYGAQEATAGSRVTVPWTVLAGLAASQTDYGRISPYDSADRYPTRPVPPYLAANPGGLTVGPASSGAVGPVAGLNSEQTTNAATIVAVGKQLGIPEYGQVIALATAMQESSLVNLNYGDRDSLGLFQQRPSQGWGTAEQIQTPTYATAKFYEGLLRVPNWSTMPVTVAAQAVQRSAYPSAYAKHEPLARSLVDKLAGSVPAQGGTSPGTLPVVGTSPAAGVKFIQSVPGSIVSGYGPRIHPQQGRPHTHTGIDIMRPCGSPILASAAGVVTYAGYTDSWGNRVKIEHAPGLETAYAHQSKMLVKVGDPVAQGDTIGLIGTTGWSTGCHLHWDVLINGNYVDPKPYYEGSAAATPGATPAAPIAPAAAYVEKGGENCRVAPPTMTIGGGPGEGHGPYLLNPAAAEDLGETAAQNPCESAQYVAKQLAAAAADVLDDGQFQLSQDDPKESARFWQQAVLRAGIMSEPSAAAVSCTVLEDPDYAPPVDVLIDSIWRCELNKARTLEVVSGVEASNGQVNFVTYDRAAATAQLVEEAKAVSWNFSKWQSASCKKTDKLAGIFPLTQQVATRHGSADRCDVQGNIRAAARAVIAGEATPVQDRASGKSGPYEPMIGGWAAIPAALGKERATFALQGPVRDWNASSACASGIETYLIAAARDGSPFVALANGKVPADTAKLTAWLKKTKGDPATSKACGAPSAVAFASAATEIAHALTGDSSPGRGPQADDPAAIPAVAPPPDLATWDELGHAADAAKETPPPPAPEPDPAPAAELGFNLDAMRGLTTWYTASAVKDAPAKAKFGKDSLIDRLSPTRHLVERGPVATQIRLAAAPWQQVATDWAYFYGGFLRGDDTFGKRIGSLLQMPGQTTSTVASWGTASQQAQIVIDAAKKWLGTPYSWGGGTTSGPGRGIEHGANTVGFDCSSLVQYAFAQAGISLPRTATPQGAHGTVVAGLAEAQPGDLLLFGKPSYYHHIGIYLGDNKMIHAPRTGDVVKIASVYEKPSLIKRVVKDGETPAS